MVDTADLERFIQARLAEDEAAARACDGDAEVEWIGDDAAEHYLPIPGEHIGRHLPSRVLRQVEALRQVVSLLADHMPNHGELAAIASIWSDHRDYPLRPTPEPAAVEVTGTWSSSAVIAPGWLS